MTRTAREQPNSPRLCVSPLKYAHADTKETTVALSKSTEFELIDIERKAIVQKTPVRIPIEFGTRMVLSSLRRP